MQVGAQQQLNRSTNVLILFVDIDFECFCIAILHQVVDVVVTEIFLHQLSVFDELLNAQQRLNFSYHLIDDLQNAVDLNLEFKFARRFLAISFVVVLNWNTILREFNVKFFRFTFFIEVENFLLYFLYGNRRALKLLHNWRIDKVKVFFILWKLWKIMFARANSERNSCSASPSSGSKKSSKLISLMAHEIAICGNLDTKPESPLNQLREIIILDWSRRSTDISQQTTAQTAFETPSNSCIYETSIC